MIVDMESDLNVYVDMAKKAKAKHGDAVDCCGTSAKGAASSVAETAGCCAAEKIEAGCYPKAENDATPCRTVSVSAKTDPPRSKLGAARRLTQEIRTPKPLITALLTLTLMTGLVSVCIMLFSYAYFCKGRSKSSP